MPMTDQYKYSFFIGCQSGTLLLMLLYPSTCAHKLSAENSTDAGSCMPASRQNGHFP